MKRPTFFCTTPRSWLALAWGLLLGLWGGESWGQVPGSLDMDFGQGGWKVMDLDVYDASVDVAVGTGDRLVVLANTGHADSMGFDMDVALVGLLPDGELDLDFGQGGVTRFDFMGNGYSQAVDLCRLGDGRCAVLGLASDGSAPGRQVFGVMVAGADGQPDLGFGQGGYVNVGFMGEYQIAEAVVEDREGKLLLVGAAYDSVLQHLEYPCIARLLPDGRPDSSFGHYGRLALNYATGIQDAKTTHSNGGAFYDVVCLEDGRILCGGSSLGAQGYTCALVMLLPDGRLDSSFQTNGVLTWDMSPGCNNYIQGLELLPDGSMGLHIYMDCWYLAADQYYFRMPLEGVPNTAQNLDGGDAEFSEAMAYDQGGYILLTGRAVHHGQPTGWYSDRFSLCRVDAQAGALDAGIGEGGWFHGVPEQATQSGAAALALQSDGGIVLAGFVQDGDTAGVTDLALARIHAGVALVAEGDAEGVNLEVGPQPASGWVDVDAGDVATRVVFYGLDGKVVGEWSLPQGKGRLGLEGLAGGMYVLSAENRKGMARQRVVVVKE